MTMNWHYLFYFLQWVWSQVYQTDQKEHQNGVFFWEKKNSALSVHACVTTGSSSSSCEMIILWKKSHCKIIRICMGIFTTTLMIKKISQILIKIPHLASTVHFLLSERLLCWKELILASCPLRAFLMYIVNLEMDDLLKWVLFNIVSSQITSNALWK